MDHLLVVLQLAIAFGIANVWLVRANRATPFRGGDSKSLQEEFAAYGLSPQAMKVVGGLKLLFAALLIAGIWIPELIRPAAIGMTAMMLGAVAMHVKVKDELIRSVPALCMLTMSVGVLLLSR